MISDKNGTKWKSKWLGERVALDKVVKEGWNLNDKEEIVMEKLEDIYFII